MALKPARLQWAENGTLTSADYGDVYFQPQDAAGESRYVFLDGNNLPARFAALQDKTAFHVAELGFGTGLNFLLTAKAFKDHAPSNARLVYVSFEKHPVAIDDLARIHAHWPELATLAQNLQAQYPPMAEGMHHITIGNMRLILVFGDIADTLPQTQGMFDAWYLDGFAPAKNPGMWDGALFRHMALRTQPDGTAATFSAAGHVRRGLTAAGFTVQKTKGFGTKRDMTVATMPGTSKSTKTPGKATVLGAGLAGCAAARALAEKGIAVTVIDRQASFAMETSGNPLGVLYPKLTVDPSPMGAFHMHGFCRTLSFLKERAVEGWKQSGVSHLNLAAEDTERTQKLLQQDTYPENIAQYDEGRNALSQPTGGFLPPASLCAALLDHPHIKTQFNTSIDILPQGDDPIIIALGMGSMAFAETAWLPLESLRGQMTMIAATKESKELDTVICHDGYITPAVEGTHYIGATFQKEPPGTAGTRPEDDADNIARLQKHLPHLFPDTPRILSSRAGYRVTTPDKLPIIGRAPNYAACIDVFADLRKGQNVTADVPVHDNVYISTGFGSHGLSGTLIAGDIIAALMTGDALPVPNTLMPHLAPERFILRGLKRGKI